MVNVFLVPRWFYGYDIFFELIFAIITLIVSYYSYKMYKLTNESQLRLFSISFLFFSAYYFIQSFLNLGILEQINNKAISMFNLMNINFFNTFGIFLQAIFFTIGLVTLLYMTLDLDSKKIYLLLLLITLPLLFFSSNGLLLFYLLASILLVFIALFYFKNYTEKKSINSLLVFIAFDFLLFGQIHFIFSVNHAIYYVIGHFLELTAYIMILINLILISKNGQKKRKTANYP